MNDTIHYTITVSNDQSFMHANIFILIQSNIQTQSKSSYFQCLKGELKNRLQEDDNLL